METHPREPQVDADDYDLVAAEWRRFKPNDPPVVEKRRRIRLYAQRFSEGRDIFTGEPLTAADLDGELPSFRHKVLSALPA